MRRLLVAAVIAWPALMPISARATGITVDNRSVSYTAGASAEAGDQEQSKNDPHFLPSGSGAFNFGASVSASASASGAIGSAQASTSGTFSAKGDLGSSGTTLTVTSSGTAQASGSSTLTDPNAGGTTPDSDGSSSANVDLSFTLPTAERFTFNGNASGTFPQGAGTTLTLRKPDFSTVFQSSAGTPATGNGVLPAGSYELQIVAGASTAGCCVNTQTGSGHMNYDYTFRIGGDPVVFVHGFLGSNIFCGAKETWPDLPFPDFARMSLGHDGVSDQGCGPHPGQLVLSALGSSVYDTTEKFLQDKFGDDAYFYAWDWRKSPELAVAGLDQIVERARCGGQLPAGATTCQNPVSDKVVLMAHSMGGLVVRLYLEDAAHRAKVSRVVTVATPYWGSPKAVFPFAYGVETPDIGLGLDLVTTKAGLKGFARFLTGLFFLWPSASYGNWLSIEGRSPVPLDQAGVLKFVSDLGGNPAILSHALAVHASTLDSLPGATDPDYQTVIGSGRETIGAVSIHPGLLPNTDLVSAAWVNGDGTVPLRSAEAATPPARRHFVCGVGHVPLPGDPGVDQRLSDFLLSGDPISDAGPGSGLCSSGGVEINVYSLKATGLFPATDQARVRTAASGTMTLKQAELHGLIEVLDTGHQLLAATSSNTPLTLSVPVTGATVRVTPLHNGQRGVARTFLPSGTGTLALSLTGSQVISAKYAGKALAAHADDHTPPRTTVRITRRAKAFVLRFTVRDASPTRTYVKIAKRVLQVHGQLRVTRAQLRNGILVQSIDSFGNREKARRISRR